MSPETRSTGVAVFRHVSSTKEGVHMEVNHKEIAVVTKVLKSVEEAQVVELNDLQLAYVGRGIADVIAG